MILCDHNNIGAGGTDHCCQHSPWMDPRYCGANGGDFIDSCGVPGGLEDSCGDGSYTAADCTSKPLAKPSIGDPFDFELPTTTDWCDSGYTPIKLGHAPSESPAYSAINVDEICCVDNTVNFANFWNTELNVILDQYWYNNIPFCNISNTEGCVKWDDIVHNDDLFTPDMVPTTTSPWELKYVNLGLNEFDWSSESNIWLCGSVEYTEGCTGFKTTSAGDTSMRCSCDQEYNIVYGIMPAGCDSLSNVEQADASVPGCLPDGGPCYIEAYANFCNTFTAYPINDDGQIESEMPCGGTSQIFCNCAALSGCGICLPPGDTDPNMPYCGDEPDICGIVDGNSEQWGGRYSDPEQGWGEAYCTGGYSCVEPGQCDGDGDEICEESCNGIWTTDRFCFCNCDIDNPDHYPVQIPCYDTWSDSDDTLLVWACQVEDFSGSNEVCETVPFIQDDKTIFYGRYTESYAAVFDQGCRDDGVRGGTAGIAACNYSVGYEIDCGGEPHMIEISTDVWEDTGEVGNTECCVYPAEYCVADGTTYVNALGILAGQNDLCDVDEYGEPTSYTYCPICDCGIGDSDPFLGNGVPLDCNEQCGGLGYTETQYVGPPNQISSDLLLDGTCSPGNLCVIYAGMGGQVIPEDMQDDGSNSAFELYGCSDEAALNYDTAAGLYIDPNPNTGMNVQAPVTTCQYCPPSCENDAPGCNPGQVGCCRIECQSGYVFYWDEDVVNVTTQATVTDNSWEQPGNFNLGEMQGENWSALASSKLQYNSSDAYTSGACYCRDDLEFLRDLTLRVPGWENTNNDSAYSGALQLHSTGGTSNWDSFGRLITFSAGGETCGASVSACRETLMRLGGANAEENTIPTSIANLLYLQHLDLSLNYLTGTIPQEIAALKDTILYMDFSWNNLGSFDESLQTGHTIYFDTWTGLCAIAEVLGFPRNDDPWIQLYKNRICPIVGSDYSNDFSYPDCLAPPQSSEYYGLMSTDQGYQQWCEWIWNNLGYIDIPCHDGYNVSAQRIDENEDGELDCDVIGCTLPQAENYWPEANVQCPNCCRFDQYLHFPWGSNVEITEGAQGSFGGNITLMQMIQALHANIHGFQYNARGNLDVAGTPSLGGDVDEGCLEVSSYNGMGAYLTNYQINSCDYVFVNNPLADGAGSLNIDGDDMINHWDGIWLRDAGYWALFDSDDLTGVCYTDSGQFDEADDPIQVQCAGDARPLEFINRLEFEASSTYDPNGFKNYWFSFFPPGGLNISMQGIQWFEDYDIYPAADGDGNIDTLDADAWESFGRIDIAELIRQNFPDMMFPQFAPEEVELWEQAPAMISMSYSQDFVTEGEAGFTLYPTEGSPGVLTRNGQWLCSDSGNSEICYTDVYACGRAPEWIDECTPCGTDGYCIPITLKTAAEGHEKISKTKIISIPYFSDNVSASIAYGAHIFGKNIYTSSLSSSNHPYYFNVTDGDPNDASSDTQFAVSWGHIAGSGSNTKNDSIKGSSEAIYKQYSSMLLDDALVDNGFLITSGSNVRADGVDGDKDRWIYVLNFKRKNFEDQLQLGTWTIALSGSHNSVGKTIHLTDNSQILTTPVVTTILNSQGDYSRRFDIISGSSGNAYAGYTGIGERYGFFYPDAGLMIFGEKLSNDMSGSTDIGQATFNTGSTSSDQLYPALTLNSGVTPNHPLSGSAQNANNSLRFINCLRNNQSPLNSSNISSSIKLFGEKEVTEVIYVCRISGDSFNFTTNFSIISGSGRTMFTPGVGTNPDVGVMGGFPTGITSSAFLVEGESSNLIYGSGSLETLTTLENGEVFIFPGNLVTTMHGDPHTFITGIELYDEHGEMLAVARTSKPIKKAFDREVFIKVKLQF